MTLPLTTFKVFIPSLTASRDTAGRRIIEGIGSSTIVDHHGDEITLAALSKAAKTSVGLTVFMNHEYRVPQDVFGQIEAARVIKTGETDKSTGNPVYDLGLRIGVVDDNEEAVKCYGMIEKKQARLGISVGAMIPEGGAEIVRTANKARLVVNDWDPVEFSMVGIPASPRSFVDYAVKALTGYFPTKGAERKDENPRFTIFMTKALSDLAGEPLTEAQASGLVEDPAEEESEAETEVSKAAAVEPVEETLEPGDVGELTVDDFGVAKSTVLKAGTPEAEAAKADMPEGDLPLEPAQPIYPIIAPEDVEVDKLLHPDITAAKQTENHTHGHAHAHEHEHTHNSGTTQETIHSHPHAHVHSHDHDGKHPHEDGQDDYEHNHSHEGAHSWQNNEDHPHETKKTRVTVWDSDKVVEVDTGRSKPKGDGTQSAQDDTPETAGGQSGSSAETKKSISAEETADPDVGEAIILAKGTLENSGTLIKALVGQLQASRGEVARLRSERSEVLGVAKQAIDGVNLLIRRLGETPVGRKTQFAEIKDDFDTTKDIYDESVRKMIWGPPNSSA